MKIKSLDTLRYAAKSGLWRTNRNIKDELNNSFSKCNHVILILFNNETCQLEGCAKIMSEIGELVMGLWNDKTWEAKYIREVFQIRWINLCEISF
jgi:hypothetical protein